ncbi:hypothetical protein [Aquipuribacter nitratireducens]|uniref:DUF8129 domain-containing protein n=1 Tax=Aquipuribacter nitratireducens TaxID=650104 RepID=A0ABW0GQS4_9MICO
MPDLAIPDIDQLGPQQLEHRVRSLEPEEIDALVEHEEAHGNRLPVLTVLRGRLQQLADGAEPTDPDPTSRTAPADTPRPEAAGSPVSDDTQAEPSPPDPHGGPGRRQPATRRTT